MSLLYRPRIQKAKLGQMFANLRTLKSEDRSPNPTFPRCKYGQIKAEFALQRQPSVICRFSHNLKHSSAPPSKSLTSLPSDAHLHLDQPSINANTYPTPAQTSLYIIFPPTSSGNGINCFHKTQNNILNDLCSSAWSSFPPMWAPAMGVPVEAQAGL